MLDKLYITQLIPTEYSINITNGFSGYQYDKQWMYVYDQAFWHWINILEAWENVFPSPSISSNTFSHGPEQPHIISLLFIHVQEMQQRSDNSFWTFVNLCETSWKHVKRYFRHLYWVPPPFHMAPHSPTSFLCCSYMYKRGNRGQTIHSEPLWTFVKHCRSMWKGIWNTFR
jgi:hypothetical protein